MIRMKGGAAPEKPGAKPEEAIPMLRDVLEVHRMEMDNGAAAEELAEFVHQDHPNFDLRQYGFQEFGELLNYAQDKGLVRIQADEEKESRLLGAEFHPPPRLRSRNPWPKSREETSRSRSCRPATRPARFLSRASAKPQRRPRAPRKSGSSDGQKKRTGSSRPRKEAARTVAFRSVSDASSAREMI